MYVTRTIDASRTPLLVGKFHDNGDVSALTADKRYYRIPRFCIETPVLCCKHCGKPVVLKTEAHPECPDHARHMYEALYAGSNDTKKYDRATRRKMCRKSLHWLNVWRAEVAGRLGTAI